MSESAPLNNDTPVVTPVVVTPTPAPKSNLVRNIIIGVVVALLGTVAFLHYHHKAPVVKAKPVVQAPVVLPGEQPTYEDVVKTPIVEKPVVVAPVQAPVKVTPVVPVTPTVTAPVHVAPIAPPACQPIPPNHGNFVHGNSNPCWPYNPSHR